MPLTLLLLSIRSKTIELGISLNKEEPMNVCIKRSCKGFMKPVAEQEELFEEGDGYAICRCDECGAQELLKVG